MPTPHLHPRSRMTSSLFATTLLASFVVVALPHVLPCPAPRRALADSGSVDADGNSCSRRVRRVSTARRRREEEGGEGGGGGGAEERIVEFRPGTEAGDGGEQEGMGARRRRGEEKAAARRGRECPVPKPGGVLGEWLGFSSGGGGLGSREAEGKTRPDR